MTPAFLILGLLVGILVKMSLPSFDRWDWLLCLVAGIVGSLLGGFFAAFTGALRPEQCLSAIVGATALTLAYRYGISRRPLL